MLAGAGAYVRLTVTTALIRNGDFAQISRMVGHVRAAAPRGAVLVVASSSPANPWFLPGDAVDVIAVPSDRVDAQVVLHVQAASGA